MYNTQTTFCALKALLVFNLLDAVFTLVVVLSGIGYEVNPIMAELLKIGPMTFMVYKLASGAFFVFVLALLMPNRAAVWGTYVLATAYACVCTFHVVSLSYLTVVA